jgi:predicted nucleic acid-binding protein
LLYIDTSVLLPYTLTQAVEEARYRSTEKLIAKIRDGALSAATSFYALHELYVFALDNAPDFAEGADYGKAALEKILASPIRILPFVSRVERMRHARRFSRLRDATDVPHAIAASVYECEAIVAYDDHFSAISDLIPHKTPEDYL